MSVWHVASGNQESIPWICYVEVKARLKPTQLHKIKLISNNVELNVHIDAISQLKSSINNDYYKAKIMCNNTGSIEC